MKEYNATVFEPLGIFLKHRHLPSNHTRRSHLYEIFSATKLGFRNTKGPLSLSEYHCLNIISGDVCPHVGHASSGQSELSHRQMYLVSLGMLRMYPRSWALFFMTLPLIYTTVHRYSKQYMIPLHHTTRDDAPNRRSRILAQPPLFARVCVRTGAGTGTSPCFSTARSAVHRGTPCLIREVVWD